MGESTEGTPRQARNLALAVLPHDEENNQERAKTVTVAMKMVMCR
jgi:hypothetical protein